MTPSNPPKPPEYKFSELSGLVRWLIRKDILNSEQKLTFMGHILLTGCLLLFTAASYATMFSLASIWQQEWLNCPAPEFTERSQLFDKSNSPDENRQQLRLTQQLNTINNLTQKNCQIMAFFYKQYYISLIIGSGAALVFLLCIFFVSKKGWRETNSAPTNIGVNSLIITLLFLNISHIFKYSENLKVSQDLFASYTALTNEFRSSLATKQLVTNGNIKNFDGLNGYNMLIHQTDSRLNDLSSIRLGFDPTPVSDPKTKVSPSVSPSSGSGSPTPLPLKVSPSPR
jgi:hypothetical protein